jgi:hypothetical protein
MTLQPNINGLLAQKLPPNKGLQPTDSISFIIVFSGQVAPLSRAAAEAER